MTERLLKANKSTYWNYRVIEFFDPENDKPWRAIHEVYYENGKPKYYTENPASIVFDLDESTDDIKEEIERMKSALDKPVLIEKDFTKK